MLFLRDFLFIDLFKRFKQNIINKKKFSLYLFCYLSFSSLNLYKNHIEKLICYYKYVYKPL